MLLVTVLWQVAGRLRAQRQSEPLSNVLPFVALAFCPLLVTAVVGTPESSGITGASWLFLFSLALASCVAWITYLAEPVQGKWSKSVFPPLLVAAGVVTFVVVFGARSMALLSTFSVDANDLALYDQALWTSARGNNHVSSLSNLLYTSLYGGSIFAMDAAPILLLFLPLYAIDALLPLKVAGPAMLLITQTVAIGLAAVALYRLAVGQINRLPAAIIAVAFLLHFLTLRMNAGHFYPLALSVPLILFALTAYRRHRHAVYFVLVVLTLACGVDAGLAVAALGLYLLVFQRDRQLGLVTLGLGLGWTIVSVTVFIPFFGGSAAQVMAPYGAPAGQSFLTHVTRAMVHSDAVHYVGLLLVPLGFTPLLGASLLLPALPRLLLNLVADGPRYTSLFGWYEPTIAPFLFAATIAGLAWMGKTTKARGWAPPYLAGAVSVLTGCLVTAVALGSFVITDHPNLRITPHHKRGREILALIPENASVAVQAPYAVSLAQRRKLTILPQADDVDFIFFDVFHPNRGPQFGPGPALYQSALRQAFHNPDYGLRAISNGFLLFERGLGSEDKMERLSSTSMPDIQYPFTAVLSDTVVYRGFDLSAQHVGPREEFYITHYWESLAPARKPYLLFTAYPGAFRFEEAIFGLYPVRDWQPGDIVRHEQAITLPQLPDGDEYEIVIGLWYDQGEPALRSEEQLLGNDVIRIAKITAKGGDYTIFTWTSSAQGNPQ